MSKHYGKVIHDIYTVINSKICMFLLKFLYILFAQMSILLCKKIYIHELILDIRTFVKVFIDKTRI